VPPGLSEPALRDALNASLLQLQLVAPALEPPCLSVQLAAGDAGYAFAEFSSLATASAALAAELLPCAGVSLRLQRPREYRPLALKPPDGAVTARIDALIGGGVLQPAHISDRLWEMLHCVDSATALAALSDWAAGGAADAERASSAAEGTAAVTPSPSGPP
jgi:hypothetical protein